VPDERAQLYAEAMRRGAPIVVAHTDHDAKKLAHELDQKGSLDLDAAGDRWRKSGWSSYDPNAAPFDENLCAGERAALTRESGFATEGQVASDRDLTEGRDLEVIEEHVRVGKREVAREHLRVRTFIAERPVKEQVELREEHIQVEREAVDQPISSSALDSALTEDEFEVTARGEEAVVGKEARVVERVHVGKTTETHTETIEATERRRDVEVEPIDEPKTRGDRPPR
jgi:stress response protein YsnF